ncbi:hypothetical protein [Serratia ureilytica]|uniref:hypothetical protein n=1 Tax=Serratia ureilytica TaxID=300181 RepID=UPI0018E8A2B8|nr:hypothetical protein [Serratia ureilytica]MBJ2095402.1 hypothetical protein [Serratia ureilytica]
MKSNKLMSALMGAALMSVCGVASAQERGGDAVAVVNAAKIIFQKQCQMERVSVTKSKMVCRYTNYKF